MKRKNDKTKKIKSTNLLSDIKQKVKKYLDRRPHRSFRRTKRRDYIKSFKLPGYIAFTKEVLRVFWRNRKNFFGLIFLFAIITFLLVGMASQDILSTLRETIDSAGGDFFSGFWGEVEKTSLLFFTALTGGMSEELTSTQQLYGILITLMAWLSTIWLLRNILAGHKLKIRDAIYNSGSPILSTFLVSLLLLVQAIPIMIAMIAYGAAATTGLLDGGVEAMLFWIFASLLAVLSLYWMTSTLISLVVVTLPGMYPYQAIKIGGNLVTGRRLKIMFRFLWMIILTLLFWAIILIPIMILDSWLKGIWDWFTVIPIVPIVILILSSFSVVWVSSFVYLLYRKVVEDDEKSSQE